MTLNPACTRGTATRQGSTVTAYCGCGWTESGFPSRRKALTAQKEHRFPGPNPADQPPPTPPQPLWLPRTPPSIPTRTTGT